MGNKIPQSVLVVIHTADLQVLLIERADRPGFWQSVTGSKDSLEEDWRSTAIREVAEETGFLVLPEGVSQDLPVPQPLSAASVEIAVRDEYPLAAACLSDWQMENVYEIYPVWRHRYPEGVTHNTEHVFGLQLPAALPPRLSPREHRAYRWLPWRAAADLCFSPSNAEAVLQLSQRYPEASRLS